MLGVPPGFTLHLLPTSHSFNPSSSQYCRPISTQSITSTDSGDSEENYVPMVSLWDPPEPTSHVPTSQLAAQGTHSIWD